MFLNTTEILETRGTFQLKLKQNIQPSSPARGVNLYTKSSSLWRYRRHKQDGHMRSVFRPTDTELGQKHLPLQGAGVLPAQFTAGHSYPPSRHTAPTHPPPVITGTHRQVIKPTRTAKPAPQRLPNAKPASASASSPHSGKANSTLPSPDILLRELLRAPGTTGSTGCSLTCS